MKNLKSTYVKADPKKVAAYATHINTKEITQILSLLKDFEYLFDINLGDWETDTVYLELNNY